MVDVVRELSTASRVKGNGSKLNMTSAEVGCRLRAFLPIGGQMPGLNHFYQNLQSRFSSVEQLLARVSSDDRLMQRQREGSSLVCRPSRVDEAGGGMTQLPFHRPDQASRACALYHSLGTRRST